jgi:hypothetical protein
VCLIRKKSVCLADNVVSFLSPHALVTGLHGKFMFEHEKQNGHPCFGQLKSHAVANRYDKALGFLPRWMASLMDWN